MLADINVTGTVTLTGAGVELYDYGVGNPPNPNQAGNIGVVNFWTVPTTWNGNHQLLPISLGGTGNWTLAAVGAVTVNGGAGESLITIAPPAGGVTNQLTPGNYGLLVEVRPPTAGTNAGPLHCLLQSPPVGTTTINNQWINLSNQALQNDAFFSGAGPNNQINVRLNFTPAANLGYSAAYGNGCYFSPQMYREQFNAPTNIDLQNGSYQHVFLGDHYLVAAPAPVTTVTAPLSASLSSGAFTNSTTASWDDALVAVTLPASWNSNTGTFPYAGGSTTQLYIGSNGQVFLGASTNAYGYYSAIVALRNSTVPVIAIAHGDWDCSIVPANAGLFYDVDPSGTKVYITWLNVPEWVPANNAPQNNTFQMVLYPNGNFEFRYGATVASSAAEFWTGYCHGNGVADPGPMDISAALGGGSFQTGNGAIPPVLALTTNQRPQLGTTVTFETSNITAGTLFNVFVMGFAGIPAPGINLGFLGMPGCFQLIQPVTTLVTPVLSGIASSPLGIPNSASYLGTVVFAQSAPLTAGYNTAGIVTSNGLCIRVGL
jgi:hypothetical protein